MALVVGLSVAAGAAHAVPIVFDFTGTVWQGTQHYDFVNQVGSTDVSTAGQVVTGRVVVETDGLLRSVYSQSNGTSITHTDMVMDPAELVTTELFIGGIAYDINVDLGNHGGGLSAFDSNGGPSCAGCTDSAILQPALLPGMGSRRSSRRFH